jgi:hypothetical protein
MKSALERSRLIIQDHIDEPSCDYTRGISQGVVNLYYIQDVIGDVEHQALTFRIDQMRFAHETD